jgi:hypothetical protein
LSFTKYSNYFTSIFLPFPGKTHIHHKVIIIQSKHTHIEDARQIFLVIVNATKHATGCVVCLKIKKQFIKSVINSKTWYMYNVPKQHSDFFLPRPRLVHPDYRHYCSLDYKHQHHALSRKEQKIQTKITNKHKLLLSVVSSNITNKSVNYWARPTIVAT